MFSFFGMFFKSMHNNYFAFTRDGNIQYICILKKRASSTNTFHTHLSTCTNKSTHFQDNLWFIGNLRLVMLYTCMCNIFRGNVDVMYKKNYTIIILLF